VLRLCTVFLFVCVLCGVVWEVLFVLWLFFRGVGWFYVICGGALLVGCFVIGWGCFGCVWLFGEVLIGFGGVLKWGLCCVGVLFYCWRWFVVAGLWYYCCLLGFVCFLVCWFCGAYYWSGLLVVSCVLVVC